MKKDVRAYTCDVLIVDDDEFNLRVAGDILKEDYRVGTAQSGEAALEFLAITIPRLILLDLHMPRMDGRETMRRIRENDDWKKIPIIFLTSDNKPETEKECLVLGASDFITKPFVPMVMQCRIHRIIELSELQNDLESKLEEKTKLVEKVSLNAITVIANTIDAKDTYTSGHSVRVAKCSAAIARRLNWKDRDIQNLYYIALLHDIGKIGVPDAVLNKPARLNDEEFEVIKKHPVIGNDILKDIYMIRNVAEGALYHHERYDGQGYPFGLVGEEIPLCARIIGIADAYDAMNTDRVYRKKLSNSQVIEELKKARGTQFDPELIDLFLEMLEDHFDVAEERDISWDDDLAKENTAPMDRVLTKYTTDIQRKAVKDSLTNLYSRSYAEDLVGRLIREGHTGSLLMIDLDNFKRINDSFGHIVGDRTLKLFADTLKSNAKDDDVACRLGGDEFMMFLTDESDRQEVTKRAQSILDMFSESLTKMECNDVTSVSIGIAMNPTDGKTLETLYSKADKSLYYVKRSGKNSYSFYSDEKSKEKDLGTGTDLDHIRRMIEGNMVMAEKGVFKVEYDDFSRLYAYISRGVKRNRQQVQTLLFTLVMDHRESRETDPEEAMKALELAVASSLRMVDVGTKYSSMQYMVILMDTNLENGKMVAQRVINQFHKIYENNDVTVSFDIQTMLSKLNEGTEETTK